MDYELVVAREVTKRFPGVLALDRVSLRIVGGQVNALVGENGAGKSTLMNILSGVYTDYEGDVLVDGEVQHFQGVADAQQKGIAIIHQELSNVPYMNIAENMFMGREPLTRFGLVDHQRMHREARQWLDRLHLNVDTHMLMNDLRVGQQQLVEIAKALMLQARVLIMDEPTSSLTDNETEILFALIEELKAQGVGIVYISHKMDEVWRLADFVTIMRDGQLIAERPLKADVPRVPFAGTVCQPTAPSPVQGDLQSPSGVITPDEIVQLMVGRERKEFFVKEEHPLGDTMLQVEHLTWKDAAHPGRNILTDISLSVRSGEVLGIYGLMGAGRTELFEAIFGLHPKEVSGSLMIDGKPLPHGGAGGGFPIRHPEEAVACGLALCPEDRKREGLVLGMTIEKNTTLAALADCLTHGLLDPAKERKAADDYRQQLGIKSTSILQQAGQLSGGNQQKIVLGKWLMTRPKVLFLDEPTRGIDIHAKNEIYRLVNQLAAEGMAIIVVSSELPEIMALSDRIITLREGCIGETFDRQHFDDKQILKASLPITHTDS